MFLVRLILIWPLKAVAPLAYSYLTWQMVQKLTGGTVRVKTTRPPGLLPLLRASVSWGLSEMLRVWMSVECVFFLYYHFKRWQLEGRAANAPMLPPGVPMQHLKRALESVKMIQVGGKYAEPNLVLSRSLPSLAMSRRKLLTPPLSPRNSVQDLQEFLHSQTVDESGIEQLLRDWQVSRSAASSDFCDPICVTDADRAAIETLTDQAETLALKQAETSGWFLKCPERQERWPISRLRELKRGNVDEWVAWAFFNCQVDEVPESRKAETQELTDEIMRWMEVDLEPGYNPEAVAMRLTMDPIPSAHRPLIYYAVTQAIFSQIIHFQLTGMGFGPHWSGTLHYWHRPPTSPPVSDAAATRARAAPIVFCHGIGVNVLPYRPFLNEMLERFPDRSFFLISLPHISMRIKEEVPSNTEMVACLSDMLATWGFPSAHFVGHSFGSLPLAWMARKAPNLVSAMTFMDPVCFLLVKPDVCYNFMYRKPNSPTQLLINYFLAKELYIAHSLSRNFFWHQNQLWPEELPPGPTLVVLSGRDSIVPAHSVRRYLTTYKQRCNLTSLRVLWFPDLGHGEINFGPVGEAACTRIVSEMLSLEAEHPPVSLEAAHPPNEFNSPF
ncbi:unnamed protein product [Polarella glacialis]|uniref:AB hydrolase-1 domain-containing protein n=1 Tax=Polarella glacialis TaxID=89957 RepID=A0A813HYE9_POLGL|nr:unnamed protein product [Polarella glacialis]